MMILSQAIRYTLNLGLTCMEILQKQDEVWGEVEEHHAEEAKAWLDEQVVGEPSVQLEEPMSKDAMKLLVEALEFYHFKWSDGYSLWMPDNEIVKEAEVFLGVEQAVEEPVQGLQTSEGLKAFTDRGYNDK